MKNTLDATRPAAAGIVAHLGGLDGCYRGLGLVFFSFDIQ
jgi:hypothetical protein